MREVASGAPCAPLRRRTAGCGIDGVAVGTAAAYLCHGPGVALHALRRFGGEAAVFLVPLARIILPFRDHPAFLRPRESLTGLRRRRSTCASRVREHDP
ncbi:MAG: hypothetical protein EA350_03870 [Gemmatimonadales bacterium]|nr:MAG: hypothetical protein EA350_03870 [Gemmatimonadales bacterium]